MRPKKQAPTMLDESQAKAIDQIIQRFNADETRLVEILLEVQKVLPGRYISKEAAYYIADSMGLPISQVYDVITFYSAINEKPRGKYDIQVCNSIVCKVNNNAFLIKTLESLLNIKAGEVTPDQKFSITLTQCIGQCDKAPALRINQQVYGHLDSEEKIKQLISSLE